MVDTSDEYYKAIYKSGRQFDAKAEIKLSDGNILNVKNTDIMQGGITIEDAVSDPNKFELGGAIIGELTLVLNNLDDEFSSYDFYNAEINLHIGLVLSDGTTEWIPKGHFTVNEATAENSTITITALDNMSKFDKPYTISALEYPATLSDILQNACYCCDVELYTQDFLNANYEVYERPGDEKITFREIISWAAQLACCFARINYDGKLVLDWYDYSDSEFDDNLDGGNFLDYNSGDTADGGNLVDYRSGSNFDGSSFDNWTNYSEYEISDDVYGGNFLDYESGDAVDGGNFLNYNSGDYIKGGSFIFAPPARIGKIRSCKIATDDITITGLRIIPTGESPHYFTGNEGYVISIEENPLVQSGVLDLLRSIGERLIGFTFREYSAEAISNPAAEAGDVALIIDRNGNRYKSVVSNLSFTIGDYESFAVDAQSPSRQESTKYSAKQKAIYSSKNEIQKQLSSYDSEVCQHRSLMANLLGIHETSERGNDGSIVFYAHDKPTISESSIIWKRTKDTFSVSKDGGETWNEMTNRDSIVAHILTNLGIEISP